MDARSYALSSIALLAALVELMRQRAGSCRLFAHVRSGPGELGELSPANVVRASCYSLKMALLMSRWARAEVQYAHAVRNTREFQVLRYCC